MAEYLYGEFPSADASDYDPNMIAPGMIHLTRELKRLKITGPFRISIVGRMYTSGDKDGRRISGFSNVISPKNLENAMRNSQDYNERWKLALGMNHAPIHVTGISIVPLE